FLISPPTPETYTLSLHDALPISDGTGARRTAARNGRQRQGFTAGCRRTPRRSYEDSGEVGSDHWSLEWHRRGVGAGSSWRRRTADRKSTRLNSSHDQISYAVFCL